MREILYEFFKNNPKPHGLNEILRRFKLEKREAKRLLGAMVEEGLLDKVGSAYRLAERAVGPISLHRDGYGFVRVEGGKDLFIPPGYTLDAWPGDLVEARPMTEGKNGRPWGGGGADLETGPDPSGGKLRLPEGVRPPPAR